MKKAASKLIEDYTKKDIKKETAMVYVKTTGKLLKESMLLLLLGVVFNRYNSVSWCFKE